MKRKLEISELIFRILSYFFLTVFALMCLYPFVYAISASISGSHAVEYSEVILFPKDVQFEAFSMMFQNNMFWNSYSNTLFLTLYGTVWALGVSILGAYALSKKRLLFRKTFNFFLVFTMWFSAGIVPQYLNYLETQKVFRSIGIMDDKWLVVIAMGMAAMNIILLRNAFENVPSEIEEAAIVDGASEFQIVRIVAMPLVKPILAINCLTAFMHAYNGWEWALIICQKKSMWTIAVWLYQASIWWSSEPWIVSAGFIIASIPTLLVFLSCQKIILRGIVIPTMK